LPHTAGQMENKISLGFVEGLNNKIRVIQRRARGAPRKGQEQDDRLDDCVWVSTLVEFTNMVLGVELEAKPADQVELRLQQVDMLLLVMH
jgi:hypothetical protein